MQGRRVVRGASRPAFIAGIGAGLGFGAWLVLSWDLMEPGLDDAPAVKVAPEAPRKATTPEEVHQIVDRNMFDRSKPKEVKACEPGSPGCDGAGETLLTLRGTVVAEPAKFSAAFIAIEAAPTANSYGLGSVVAGAEIVEIRKDAVVLQQDGKRRVLRMADAQGVSVGAVPPEDLPAADDVDFVISAAEVARVRATGVNPLNEFRKTLHYGADGQPDGYVISGVAETSLARKYGLRNGDVVTLFNGQRLSSLPAAFAAASREGDDGIHTLVIRRDGEDMELTYRMGE